MRGNGRRSAALAVVALLALPVVTASAATTAGGGRPFSAAARCASLRALDLEALPGAPTRMATAEVVPADRDVPGHCLVRGYVAPQVSFELRLPDPAGWNGDFFFGGCGGLCGSLDTDACVAALGRGYAAATTDTGHRGADPRGLGTVTADALWAYGNEPAVVDWAHRGVHVATVATKKLTEVFYRRAIGYSYFAGCSNGGRQALAEAQRHPHDFDGIWAGDAGLDFRTVTLNWAWAANANLDAAGRPIVTEADVPLVHDAVLDQCDALDGRADGMLDDPRACRLDLSALECRDGRTPCLDDRKVEALRLLYRTPTDSRGVELTDGGLLPGSEGDWPVWLTGTGGAPPLAPLLVDGMLRYLAFDEPPGPDYDPRAFDFDADPPRMTRKDALISADDPDLSAFRASGGKLLMTADWADGVLQPRSSPKYFDRVAEALGGVAEARRFFRLFLIPGKNHCSSAWVGGPTDPLRILEDWVERGTPPTTVTVGYDGGVTRSFPAYPST
ncbi:tannase/feruloyl esterase family alpha/beta hydrolase [Saccharothrix australiensis]|uniref:Feruloyl esterase n=1 Tax=Saccharothrix australiensis TaxID=2072 RepID=A0A495W4M5_9PSEU|nr:tannase/feruloyl esterase family alpha/beta hydrolase [Saccharothrix australiensis]RKT54748.1 feruloyl esterase [Saccharothrix australiensis]